MKTMTLDIPEEFLVGVKIPRNRLQADLKRELGMVQKPLQSYLYTANGYTCASAWPAVTPRFQEGVFRGWATAPPRKTPLMKASPPFVD